MTKDFEDSAKAHWIYTGGIVELSLPDVVPKKKALEIMAYLYIKGMVHGYKHGKEDR